MIDSNDAVVINGLGLWTPEYSESNNELMVAYNGYAKKLNAYNATIINLGYV